MNAHDVNIKVPASEEQSSTIVVTGAPNNVEGARKALLAKVEELEKEKAEKELKSYEVKVEVDPAYHPKIIGRKGTVITELRDKYKVNIQLPKKDDKDASVITITGHEKDANEARDAIMRIVSEFVSFVYTFSVSQFFSP